MFAARLGTSHRHQLLLPVQVLQPESADFADSQSVNGEQHDYGTIPDLLSGIAFRSREQALHAFPRWAFWQLLIGKQARGHNRHCQTRSAPAAVLGVAKEAAQRGGVGLNLRACVRILLAFASDVGVDVDNGDFVKGTMLLLKAIKELRQVPAATSSDRGLSVKLSLFRQSCSC